LWIKTRKAISPGLWLAVPLLVKFKRVKGWAGRGIMILLKRTNTSARVTEKRDTVTL